MTLMSCPLMSAFWYAPILACLRMPLRRVCAPPLVNLLEPVASSYWIFVHEAFDWFGYVGFKINFWATQWRSRTCSCRSIETESWFFVEFNVLCWNKLAMVWTQYSLCVEHVSVITFEQYWRYLYLPEYVILIYASAHWLLGLGCGLSYSLDFNG